MLVEIKRSKKNAHNVFVSFMENLSGKIAAT